MEFAFALVCWEDHQRQTEVWAEEVLGVVAEEVQGVCVEKVLWVFVGGLVGPGIY